jgi:hypothetical protein
MPDEQKAGDRLRRFLDQWAQRPAPRGLAERLIAAPPPSRPRLTAGRVAGAGGMAVALAGVAAAAILIHASMAAVQNPTGGGHPVGTSSPHPSPNVSPNVSPQVSPFASPTASDEALPVACATLYAGAQPTPGAIVGPTAETVAVPASLIGKVALYSDATGAMPPVLGPSGWGCAAMWGADGSPALLIFPPGQSFSFDGPAETLPAGVPQIRASNDARCSGCFLGDVCPFVTSVARERLLSGYPSCPARPPQETVTFLQGSASPASRTFHDVISFEDPPGVAGDGIPSGGPYPARAVLLVSSSPDAAPGTLIQTDSLETCSLPSAQQALCSLSLQQFAAENWMLPTA